MGLTQAPSWEQDITTSTEHYLKLGPVYRPFTASLGEIYDLRLSLWLDCSIGFSHNLLEWQVGSLLLNSRWWHLHIATQPSWEPGSCSICTLHCLASNSTCLCSSCPSRLLSNNKITVTPPTSTLKLQVPQESTGSCDVDPLELSFFIFPQKTQIS